MRLYDVGRLRAEDIEDVDGEDEDDVDDERDDNDDDDDGDDDAVALNGSDDGEGNLCYDASRVTAPNEVNARSGFPNQSRMPMFALIFLAL